MFKAKANALSNTFSSPNRKKNTFTRLILAFACVKATERTRTTSNIFKQPFLLEFSPPKSPNWPLSLPYCLALPAPTRHQARRTKRVEPSSPAFLDEAVGGQPNARRDLPSELHLKGLVHPTIRVMFLR